MNNIDLTTNVESDNLNNNTSSNGSSNGSSNDSTNSSSSDKKKRIRYKYMSESEAKRIVEETTTPDDTTCIICFDNEGDHQLIHLTQKNGEKKENLCQKRYCLSCIQKCVVNQTVKGRFIIPRCPCCKQTVEKVVNVKNLKVTDLPGFVKPTFIDTELLQNAQKSKFYFVFNATIDDNKQVASFDQWDILSEKEWDVDRLNYKFCHNNWNFIWKDTLRYISNDIWPSPTQVLKRIKSKLEAENLLDRNWLPPIYGGTMKVPKRKWTNRPEKNKKKAKTTKKRLKKE